MIKSLVQFALAIAIVSAALAAFFVFDEPNLGRDNRLSTVGDVGNAFQVSTESLEEAPIAPAVDATAAPEAEVEGSAIETDVASKKALAQSEPEPALATETQTNITAPNASSSASGAAAADTNTGLSLAPSAIGMSLAAPTAKTSSQLRFGYGSKMEYYFENSRDLYADLKVSIPLVKKLRLDISQSVSDQLEDDVGAQLDNTRVSLAKGKLAKVAGFDLGASVRATLPTSQASRDAGHQGQLRGAVSLVREFGKFSLRSGLDYAKEFYRETRNSGGGLNPEHAFGLSIAPGVTLGKASLGVSSRLVHRVAYQPDAVGFAAELPRMDFVRYDYANSIDIGYELTKSLSVETGLTTASSFIDSAGRQQEYTFYRQNKTSAYIDFIISF
jgi:hypothetical protein